MILKFGNFSISKITKMYFCRNVSSLRFLRNVKKPLINIKAPFQLLMKPFKYPCQILYVHDETRQEIKQASGLQLIKKETLAQVFSCEFCKISKNTFCYRTPPVAASLNPTLTFNRFVQVLFFLHVGVSSSLFHAGSIFIQLSLCV